jgi:predicted ArsR family transcriptional regulator
VIRRTWAVSRLITRAVLDTLVDHAHGGEVTISLAAIAGELDISRGAVFRAIHDLLNDGVIARVVRGGGRRRPASTYVLSGPGDG